MAKICAIGERKIVLDAICEKREAHPHRYCQGCYASIESGCLLDDTRVGISVEVGISLEDGGSECAGSIWVKVAEATPALIAAAWARQAVATLPELPESLTGPTAELAKLAKAGVELILNKLINELEGNG